MMLIWITALICVTILLVMLIMGRSSRSSSGGSSITSPTTQPSTITSTADEGAKAEKTEPASKKPWFSWVLYGSVALVVLVIGILSWSTFVDWVSRDRNVAYIAKESSGDPLTMFLLGLVVLAVLARGTIRLWKSEGKAAQQFTLGVAAVAVAFFVLKLLFGASLYEAFDGGSSVIRELQAEKVEKREDQQTSENAAYSPQLSQPDGVATPKDVVGVWVTLAPGERKRVTAALRCYVDNRENGLTRVEYNNVTRTVGDGSLTFSATRMLPNPVRFKVWFFQEPGGLCARTYKKFKELNKFT